MVTTTRTFEVMIRFADSSWPRHAVVQLRLWDRSHLAGGRMIRDRFASYVTLDEVVDGLIAEGKAWLVNGETRRR